MQRAFVKNILFVLAINLLIKSAWIFMIDRTVQNRVGHEAYGIYQTLFNLGLIFQIVLDFGLNSYNTRVISQQPGRLKELFPAMLSTRLILVLVYILGVCSIGWIRGFRGAEIALLLGVLLIQGMNGLLLYIRSNVAALQRFRLDGVLSVTDRFLMILVCGSLLFYPPVAKHFTIEWFVLAQIGCYGAAFILSLFVLKRISRISFRLSFQLADILKVIKSGLPYALLIFLMSVHTRSDILLIEGLCGPQGEEQAGIYASAFRLLDMGNILGLMFAGMLLSMFGRILSEEADLVPIIRIAVNMLLPLSMLSVIGAFMYGEQIMHALYPVAGAYDGKVLAWLIAAFPAFCIMYVYSTLLTANGNLKVLNILAAAGVLINIGANLYFIPRQQALGAAMVAFITQTTLSVCFIIAAQRILKLPFNLRWAAAHICYPLICLPAAIAISHLPVSWILQLLILSATGLALVFLFRFVSIGSLKLLMKKP